MWRAVLDDAVRLDEQVGSCLSTDEQQRASAFVQPRDRRRFVARRALLRILLAGYVGCTPDLLPLRSGPHGKPELAGSSGHPPVSFNSSHSQGMALYAFTRERRIGVDVEAVRPLPERDQITQLYCSSREQATLHALPAGARDAAFTDAWTKKEAYLKAVGDGLTHAPDRIEVALGPDAAPALLSIDGDTHAARHWSLHSLFPAAGYAGAVALEGRLIQLDAFDAFDAPERSHSSRAAHPDASARPRRRVT